MTIAQQIKSAFVKINSNNGGESFDDLSALTQEAEGRATLVSSTEEAEITEYDFADGSVMILNSSEETARIYASR